MIKYEKGKKGVLYYLVVTAFVMFFTLYIVMLFALSYGFDESNPIQSNPIRVFVLNNSSTMIMVSIVIILLGFISIDYVTSMMVNIVLVFISYFIFPNKQITILLIGSGLLWMFADPEIFRFRFLSKKSHNGNSKELWHSTGALFVDFLRYMPYMSFLFAVFSWLINLPEFNKSFVVKYPSLAETNAVTCLIGVLIITLPIILLFGLVWLQRFISFKLNIAEKIYKKIYSGILYFIMIARIISLILAFYLTYLYYEKSSYPVYFLIIAVVVAFTLIAYSISRFKIISRWGAKTMNERVEELYNAVNDMGDGNLSTVSREEIKEYLKNDKKYKNK